MSGGRLLVVGWPGVGWGLVEALLGAGRLPQLGALASRGRAGALAVPPPLSRAAAWTTLATGLLADRHGVLADAEARPDGGGIQPAGRRSWRAPAFWETLERVGLRTACIGWPATAPGLRWPGLHVDERFAIATGCDFDRWAMLPDAVAPAAARETLRELRIHPADGLRQQVLELLPEAATLDPRDDQRPLLLAAALARVGTLHAAATHAAAGDWDVLCVCHDLVHAIGTGQAGSDAAEGPYARLLERACVLQDLMLARLVALAGAGATVMVVSADAPGFIVAAGPDIAGGREIGAASTDLAPTILARFGLRVATDGKVRPGLASPGAEPTPFEAPPPEISAEPSGIIGAAPIARMHREAAAALRGLAAERALNLAEVQTARGAPQGAAATLELLRAAQPENLLALRRLGECRAMLGDAHACRTLAEALREAAPRDPWGHLLLAACCVIEKDAAGAEPHLAQAGAQAGALGGADAGLLLRLGGLRLLLGQADGASEAFRQAEILAPQEAQAPFGLGVALTAQGAFAAAEAALRRTLALAPVQPLAHLQLATVLSAQGRWRESLAATAAAEELQPGSDAAATLRLEAMAGLARDTAAALVLRGASEA